MTARPPEWRYDVKREGVFPYCPKCLAPCPLMPSGYITCQDYRSEHYREPWEDVALTMPEDFQQVKVAP